MRSWIFFVFVAATFGFPWVANASCPDIGVAPRTASGTAAEFSRSEKYSLDADGILTFDYGKAYNNLGKFHNPYFISIYASLLYKDYLASSCKDEVIRKNFILQANWYINNAQVHDGIATWTYSFPAEVFNLKPGWVSGIGQARIAGVLYRAFAITGEKRFHNFAEMAMEAYRRSPAEGGVATIDDEVTWIEEGASTAGASYKILNGHITALTGVLDYYQITQEQEWKELYDRGVAAVLRDISKFDAGILSYYSLASPRFRQIAARRDYNSLHVHQLLWLYEQQHDAAYLEYASRFQFYELAPWSYSAKGSVNAKTNGPGQAGGYYGNAYWSHSAFPTWLQVDVGSQRSFNGITLHASSEKATPKDFTISARTDGEWKVIATEKDNADLRRTIMFSHPVKADAFRVDIDSDNGNKNVALQSFIPISDEHRLAPITNECNYRARDGHYNYDLAFDNDANTAMKVFCPGWIIMPTEGARYLDIDAEGLPDASLSVRTSDDLRSWSSETPASLHGRFTIKQPARFTKIVFLGPLTEVREIKALK